MRSYIFRGVILRMIVHIGGMIRSGSTLQFNIANKIVASVPGNRLIHANEHILKVIQEWLPKTGYAVTKCHLPAYYYNEEAVPRVKLLLTYRDIRDIAVSTISFRHRTFEDVVSTLYDETVAREEGWLAMIPAHNIYRVAYETMYVDIAAEARRIAEFLEIDISRKEAQRIEEELSIKTMRPKLKAMTNMNAHTFYGPNHIQGVVPGQWKSCLGTTQVNKIMSDPRIVSWMVSNGYF